MEEKAPLTAEEVAELRSRGIAPLSHCATRLLLCAGVLSVCVVLGKDLPDGESLGALATIVSEGNPQLLFTWVVKVFFLTSGVAIAIGLLSPLAQTFGVVSFESIKPRIRWFDDARSALVVLGGVVLGCLLGGGLLYRFGGRLLHVALRREEALLASVVSVLSSATMAVIALCFVLAIIVAWFVRWRFPYSHRKP